MSSISDIFDNWNPRRISSEEKQNINTDERARIFLNIILRGVEKRSESFVDRHQRGVKPHWLMALLFAAINV